MHKNKQFVPLQITLKKLDKSTKRWQSVFDTLATPLLAKTSEAPIWRVFFFWRKSGLRYQKPALTYSEQIDLLEKRGLRINDKALAANWLSRTNYYRFSAYLYPFRNPDDTFKPGTDFSFVCDLYNFDRRLRLLVMDAIERIEIWLRTTLTYEMAHKIGPFGYIRKRNFTKGFKHKEFMGQLLKEIERSKEEFVSHYGDKYTGEKHLPIWMATELLTFGTCHTSIMLYRWNQKSVLPTQSESTIRSLGAGSIVSRISATFVPITADCGTAH